MKTLTKLQPKLNINDADVPEYESILETVENILHREGIIFNENSRLAFYAHIINYIRRLKDHEYLDIKYDDIRKEIDQDIYEIAEEIVQVICEKYQSMFEVQEVMLIAIHIQTTRFKGKNQ